MKRDNPGYSGGGTRPPGVRTGRCRRWTGRLAAISAAAVSVIVPAGLEEAGAQAGGEGYWRFTSPLSVPRFDHTTTLLTTGDVLVAGGRLVAPQPLTNLASAEVWDPQTDRWRPTGSMNQPRWRHTATLLPNGKVLVAGGFANPFASTNAQPVHDSAELYDPVTGRFSPTGSMHTRRGLHVAQLLPNGKVLVAGGRTCGDPPPAACDFTVRTNTAEVYDPATGQFTPTGSMNAPRHTTSAVLLQNGKVLVPAGFSAPDPHDTDDTADLYEPRTGQWTLTGNLNVARARQGAMLLPDGRVVVGPGSRRTIFGPPFSAVIQTTTEYYNPRTDSWVLAGNPILPGRFNFQFTTLPNGKALMAGGWGGPAGAEGLTKTTEVFNPVTNTWSPAAPMNDFHGSSSSLANSDRVPVISASPWNFEWSPTGCSPHCGEVLVAGNNPRGTVELYTPQCPPRTNSAQLRCQRTRTR